MPSEDFGLCSATAGWKESSFAGRLLFKNYILDFVCFERKLVIEVDGGQHSDSVADRARDELLRAEGFRSPDIGTTMCCEMQTAS
jgi:hypothetical protein